jgi:two-component system, chemotaxis family, response regulator Rcp1
MTEPPPIILIVEDNPADVRLTREAFAETRLQPTLHVARDGVEALAFLRRQAPFDDAPAPDLILLDLNLPRKDGREVLREIKRDPDLRRTPVVVLTTSHAPADVQQSYALHANCYITKPVDLDRFLELVQRVEQFWLATVTLPTRAAPYA